MRNTYKVPKRQWRKWDQRARNVFNTLYGTMLEQSIFTAPRAATIPRAHWRVIAWNAAFIAACSVPE